MTSVLPNVRVDRARRLHSTFDSINQVEKEAIRALVQRLVGRVVAFNLQLPLAASNYLPATLENTIFSKNSSLGEIKFSENPLKFEWLENSIWMADSLLSG